MSAVTDYPVPNPGEVLASTASFPHGMVTPKSHQTNGSTTVLTPEDVHPYSKAGSRKTHGQGRIRILRDIPGKAELEKNGMGGGADANVVNVMPTKNMAVESSSNSDELQDIDSLSSDFNNCSESEEFCFDVAYIKKKYFVVVKFATRKSLVHYCRQLYIKHNLRVINDVMDFRTALIKYTTLKKIDKTENERRESEYFSKYYEEGKKGKDDPKESYSVIPKFYYKLPREEDVLAQKLREEARAIFLQRRGKQLLNNTELKALWVLLDKHHSPPHSDEEQMINYQDFLHVANLGGPKCRPYFTPTVFAKLQGGDPYGRVSIMALFNYVMRKVWYHQTRIGLSLYDVIGQGYLREVDLENYILELIPTLPQLDGLEKSFHSFYVCTAVRKFLFFLDPLRTGRVRIQDILACSFLDDLLELRDVDMPKDLQDSNWFSAPSALRVYGQYLNLDKDHNGMLNKEELAGYGTGTLTRAFMDRVFQECLTYDGEMDYKTYLDFVLAMENRQEPQSLHYLFRILDVDGKGYLDTFCLNYFFRAIQEQMRVHGQEPILFEDVKDEVFDMVKPANPAWITLQDLVNCGQGDTVVTILIDLNGFWTYENREAMAADTGDPSPDLM
uniref:(California timema) hypothetical protein n=1 Tax=Timema californicum TaxID=61474 RepID=A0A7R9JB96_TIMCA|nr:unnamed protein product [Timema californicum]